MLVCAFVCSVTLTLGIDLSGSNPLTRSTEFAVIAGNEARREILKLEDGDVLHVRQFGSREVFQNVVSQPITVSRRMRPAKLADSISAFVRSIPTQGNFQGSTELIRWLKYGRFDCANGGRIVILTDGIETAAVSANALLQGEASLPEPRNNLAGCSLYLYGLGAGLPVDAIDHLVAQWSAYAEAAGADFDFYVPQ